MQKAFKDIVERLEEEAYDMEICEEQFDMNSPYFMDVPYKMVKMDDVKEIVNQVAEEYKSNDGWIPCEERLPEIHEDTKSSDVVLVAGYDKNANFDWQAMGFYVKADGISRWFFADCRNTDKPIDWIDIVAWQPLPAAYVKGE